MTVKKTELYYKKGTSDKVYIIELIYDGSRSYEAYKVDCYYGRRGYSLRLTNKCGWNGRKAAERVFDNTFLSKISEGYQIKETITEIKEPLKKLGKMSIKELLKYKTCIEETPKNYDSLPDYKKITYVNQFVFNNGLSLHKLDSNRNKEEWQIIRTMDWACYDFEKKEFLTTNANDSISDLFTCLEVLENL